MDASIHTAPPPTAGAKKPRAKRASVQKYPAFLHVNITTAMAQALLRICAPSAPLNQSTYFRIALHKSLLQDDEIYRREIAAAGAAVNGGQ